MVLIRPKALLGINLAADFMNNNLNRKMRNEGKNSPWISSLRGIDPKSLKCQYGGA
jgi:hypothetical protein